MAASDVKIIRTSVASTEEDCYNGNNENFQAPYQPNSSQVFSVRQLLTVLYKRSMAMTNAQINKNGNGLSRRRRGHNEGSVFEYRGKFRAMVTVNGKRLSKTFPTKTAAQEWIRKTRNDVVNRGLDYNSAQKTLGEYMTYWLELKKCTLKPTVFPSYQLYVERDLIPNLGKIKLRELRAPKINSSTVSLLRVATVQGRFIMSIRCFPVPSTMHLKRM